MATAYPYGYPQTDRVKTCLNANWKFKLGDPEAAYYNEKLDDSAWATVCVPHTLKLTSINLDDCKDDKKQLTFQRNVGWYRKSITLDSQPAKTIYLEFEGAHQVTTLWVNGQKVGVNAIGGYTPFVFDVTSYVHKGVNQITLLVDNRICETTPPDPGMTDYVKFSGLYRDVYWVEKNPTHITFNIESMQSGVTITTPTIDVVNGNAVIDVRTEVANESLIDQKAKLVQRLVDAQGNVVMKVAHTHFIKAGDTYRFCQMGYLEDSVHFWSIEDPYLYKMNTTLYVKDKAIDVVDNNVGLRTFKLDPKLGFMLNNKPIELIGFNRHQHYGYIGDALPNSFHYKDMWQFKQLGFNVVRTAHYPQDDALIEACDKLGILVYEESPSWIEISTNKEWHANQQRAARLMVRNHKNHPSVVIWGTGINHRGPVPKIVMAVKQEDPTRLTASQNSRWTSWQCSGLADIFANMNYGPGIWDKNEPLFAMEGNYGPDVVATYKRDPMKPGIISWNAHAYYTFHPSKSARSRARLGAMDIFRNLHRGSIHWYPSELRTEPYLYLDEDWIPQTKTLTVYSNAEKIEVFVNGQSKGFYYPSKAEKYKGINHPPFEISTVRYEKGQLELKGFVKNRQTCGVVRYTPGKPYRLRLKAAMKDRQFVADGSDLLNIKAEVLDKNGTLLRDSDLVKIKFSVEGDASVIGDQVAIGANPIFSQNGYAPALIRAGQTPGKVTIFAKAKGLIGDKITVELSPYQSEIMLKNAYKIQDYKITEVDLGGEGQLVQFDWTGWFGKGNHAVLRDKGISYTITPASDKGFLRWLGEMNVIGKNSNVYADGVLCLDHKGLLFTLSNLPAGSYRLHTYHHAPESNTNSMDPNKEHLKTEVIHKLPYAKSFTISVVGTGIEQSLKMTAGKEMQHKSPALSTLEFETDGTHDVQILIKSNDTIDNVWFNAFKLIRYL